jgi:hypothetical protein
LWGALVIGGVYMTRAVRNVLHGPLPEKWNSLADASNAWRKLPYALLLASLLVFGFWPKLLTGKINPDAQKIVTMATGAVSAVAVGVAPTILSSGVTPADARATRAIPETVSIGNRQLAIENK